MHGAEHGNLAVPTRCVGQAIIGSHGSKNKHFPKLFKINFKFFLMVSRLFAHYLLTSLEAIFTVPLVVPPESTGN